MKNNMTRATQNLASFGIFKNIFSTASFTLKALVFEQAKKHWLYLKQSLSFKNDKQLLTSLNTYAPYFTDGTQLTFLFRYDVLARERNGTEHGSEGWYVNRT